jgi:hypothetical protein
MANSCGHSLLVFPSFQEGGRVNPGTNYRLNITPDRMYPETEVFECGLLVIGPISSGVSSAHPCNQNRKAIAHAVTRSASFRKLIWTDLIQSRAVLQPS